ncbi:MAG: Diadenosine hexaphosphate hydrolase [Firmicutes bacterium ADurb.Bin193]|nr:MAG: Diadenosine hexaphosphate hydrolase [Firmicutes bacterium ADurb.Bin193]
MPKIELTNMVMIQDPATGKVVVQDRLNKWPGISFPGGHVEDGESFMDSAIREIKEETGIDVKNLKLCGVVHWCNNRTYDRYIEFFYKTTNFCGELISETHEGRVFWASLDEIKKMKLSSCFAEYLTIFLSDEYSEAFYLWNEDETRKVEYK